MEELYIVRNARLNGHWGDEETTSPNVFPLKRGDAYEIIIFIADKEFLISINGKHYCAFTYRVPLSKLTELEVRGAVDVIEVSYITLDTYPKGNEAAADKVPVGNFETVPAQKLVSLPRILHLI